MDPGAAVGRKGRDVFLKLPLTFKEIEIFPGFTIKLVIHVEIIENYVLSLLSYYVLRLFKFNLPLRK